LGFYIGHVTEGQKQPPRQVIKSSVIRGGVEWSGAGYEESK